MSTIYNIYSSTNVSYVQQTTSTTQSVGRRSTDNANDSGRGVDKAGRSNLMNAIEQALGQTLSDSSGLPPVTSTAKATTSSSATQDPQAALQAFLHSLFAALHQAGGRGHGMTASDGVENGGSSPVSGVGQHHRGNSSLVANIQTLLQQLSSISQSNSATGQSSLSDALSNLNSSFQNLIDAINKSQGHGAAAVAPTLQSFLQNLQQDLSGGQNISGAVVSTKA